MSNSPKRGGLDPTYGDHVGGSLLDDDYGKKIWTLYFQVSVSATKFEATLYQPKDFDGCQEKNFNDEV